MVTAPRLPGAIFCRGATELIRGGKFGTTRKISGGLLNIAGQSQAEQVCKSHKRMAPQVGLESTK
jgi:hypothetical protein